jgi:alpha-tubulin suppressor-like RCC1 family protein
MRLPFTCSGIQWAACALALASLLVPRSVVAGPVSAGNGFMVVAMPDQTVAVWGANGSGQLGLGDTQPRAVPTAVPGLTGIVAVAAGGSHTLALTSGGLIYAFGSNASRQVGNNSSSNATSPVLLGLTGVVAIAAGDAHSLALTDDGNLWVWGSGGSGRLGTGSTSTVPTPTLVAALSNVTAIAAGGSHSLVLKSDQTVWAFGENGQGQLGQGTTTDALTPVQISSISGAPASLPAAAIR